MVAPDPPPLPPILTEAIISVQQATPLTDTRRRSSRLMGLKPTTFNGAGTITNVDTNLLAETKLPRSARKTAKRRRSFLI